jgi:hypothetical protein
MRRLLACATVVAVAAAAGAEAQLLSHIQVIPVVAHTSGLGSPPTYWVSDVAVHNPNDFEITVGFGFFPENVSNTVPGTLGVTRVLAPHGSALIENILGTAFGYTGNIKGLLLATTDPDFVPQNPPKAKFLITTRTYNTGSGDGTYGQTISSSQLYQNYSTAPSLVTGVRHDSHYRSNLGIANFSLQAITVHWTVRRADGAEVKSGSKTLQALSMGQWTFASLGISNQTGVLTVELRLDEADATPDPCNADFANSFLGYVSKVDGNPNGTGDGEHLYAVPSSFPDCFFQELAS